MRGVSCGESLVCVAQDGEFEARLVPVAPRDTHAPAFTAQVAAIGEWLAGRRDLPLWLAVGSRTSPQALGELLRQARAAGGAVQGFVDAAVSLVAWHAQSGQSIVIDIGRSQTVFSVVAVEDGEAMLRRTAVVPVGEAALLQRWLQLFAESMVRQTRYDPLHDSRDEAALRERLPVAAAEAQRDGSTHLALESQGRSFGLTLSRDQFVAAAAGWFEPLSAMLQALCAGIGDCHVLVPDALLHWPGAAEALTVIGERPLWRLHESAAAQAASLLPATVSPVSGGVRYLTQLPGFASPAPAPAITRAQLRGAAAALPATHLVHRGRAITIGVEGLVLGRAPGDGPGVLELPEGIAGLSRRHCTLRRAGGETVLVDHSRFGTFVDGQRVDGRALLAAGSHLRLGTPGIELALVALD
jgi:FHA domain